MLPQAQGYAWLNIFKKIKDEDFNCFILGKDELKELVIALEAIARNM